MSKGFKSPLRDREQEQTLKHQDVKTLEHKDVKALNQQSDMKRQTVYMPVALARKLKSHAAATDQDISGIITKLVEKYLDREAD